MAGNERNALTKRGRIKLPDDHGFHTYRQMQRWTVSPAARVEILGRYWWRIRRRATEGAKAKSKGKARRGSQFKVLEHG